MASSPFDLDHRPATGQAVELEPGVVVVAAPNPGPMTFTGTNTYLVGDESLAVIDPGPDDPAHEQALLAAIAGRPVSHILVTHSHVDHSPLARRLAATTGAPVLGFGTAREARSPLMAALAAQADLGGGEGIDAGHAPDHRLEDGARIEGEGWTLVALHTPGHLADHLCFALEEREVLFTGDHVMGWATTLVSPPDGDLTRFMASLDRLRQREDRVYFPGHGGPVRDPRGMVEHQIAHRRMRESQILDALATGADTAAGLARRIYRDVDPRLLPAAERNVLAHLLDLAERGLVAPQEALSARARFARH